MKKLNYGVFMLFIVLLLAACTNKEYEEAMEKGEDYIKEEEYEKAVASFEKALNEKEEDDVAKIYKEQTEQFIAGADRLEEDLVDAKEQFTKVVEVDDGLEILVERSEENIEEIDDLEEELVEVEGTIEQAKEDYDDGKFSSSLKILEEIDTENLKHFIFTDAKKESESLHKQLKKVMQLKQEAEEALDKAKQLEGEKKYKDGIEVITPILEKEFNHESLQSLKEELEDKKSALETADEEEKLAKEKKEKESELIEQVYGYWVNEGATPEMPGTDVVKYTKNDFYWVTMESDVADYVKITLTGADVEKQQVYGEVVESGEDFTIQFVDDNKMESNGNTLKKVSEDTLKDYIRTDDVDSFFDGVKEMAEIEFP